MAAITVDLTTFPLATRRRVLEVLHREDAAKLAIAKAEQARLIQGVRGSVGPGTTKDGIGPLAWAMHPYFVSYFRRLYGETIFQDPDFMKYLRKVGEWFHVDEAATRIQSGWRPPPFVRPKVTVAKTSTGIRAVRQRTVYN